MLSGRFETKKTILVIEDRGKLFQTIKDAINRYGTTPPELFLEIHNILMSYKPDDMIEFTAPIQSVSTTIGNRYSVVIPKSGADKAIWCGQGKEVKVILLPAKIENKKEPSPDSE